MPRLARGPGGHSPSAVSRRRRTPDLLLPLPGPLPCRYLPLTNPLTSPGRASSQAEGPIPHGLINRLHQRPEWGSAGRQKWWPEGFEKGRPISTSGQATADHRKLGLFSVCLKSFINDYKLRYKRKRISNTFPCLCVWWLTLFLLCHLD